MKMPTLAPSEVRTVSIAAVLIGVSLAYVFGIKPYRVALTTARAQLQVERDKLAKERIQVASSKNNPLLIQSVDSAMKAFSPRLFDAGGEVAASADLSNYVAGVAHDNRVFISASTTQKPVIAPSGVRTLRVEITADSDLRGILGLLEALDHGTRLVTVEKVAIEHPATSDEATDIETLRLSLIVNGYMVGDPPAPPTHGAPSAGTSAKPAVPPAPVGKGAK